MGARGRKPASELSVVSTTIPERPKAPKDLTPEQANEWDAIVSRLPPDWFQRETHAMLEGYCGHVAERKEIDRMITDLKGNTEFTVDEYDKLLKMRERENRSASSLATRLRITQQSTYDPERRKGPAAKKPWEK